VRLYAVLLLAAAVAYAGLSPAASAARATRAGDPPQSRRILWAAVRALRARQLRRRISARALFAYFFHAQFGASEAAIGALFVGARIMNAFSHLGAAWLAARIGLVNTMVFTHTPSSILTFTIPFTGSFEVAAVLSARGCRR
jgi:hypothetical protein